MFIQDKTGTYRLDAVAAVTPQQTFIHAVDGKALPFAKPSRIVAVLHIPGSAPLVTDTDYTAVLEQFAPVIDALPAALSQRGQ